MKSAFEDFFVQALGYWRNILRLMAALTLIVCIIIAVEQYPKLDNLSSQTALKQAAYLDYKQLHLFLLCYAAFVCTCGIYDLSFLCKA